MAADGAVLADLAPCPSDIHRSFWLYAHHPALFERAYDFSYWEQRGPQSQQYDLGINRQPCSEDSALTGLRLDWKSPAREAAVYNPIAGLCAIPDLCK